MGRGGAPAPCPKGRKAVTTPALWLPIVRLTSNVLPTGSNVRLVSLCYALLARIVRLVVSSLPLDFIAITGFVCIGYRLLICSCAPPVAVLRSPHRVLRPRLAPFGGWSRGFAPTRARRPVSHSCQPPRPLVAGAVIPRPVGAER